MELHGWQQCQRKPLKCTGTLSLLPPSWDTISCIYSQVVKLVSKFPYSKRLVLYFAYNGTTVKLDLGDVKAAGVVCILGLGVGLGTLFIYRLYNQYIRPFLDTQYTDPEEENSSSDCAHIVESSDSGVDGAMGNNSSGQLLPVYYSSQYGVALGGKGASPNHKKHTTADTVRLRRMGTRQKPVRTHTAERDITKQGGGGAHLSPSLYGANFRDSFYSTAESGFETLPECNEEEVDSNDGDRELSQSLQENYSASSLKERNERYFSASSGERTSSSPSASKTVLEVETVSRSEKDKSNTTAVPVVIQSELISSSKSSPAHKGRVPPDAQLLSPKKFHSYSHSEEYDYDLSLDASESIRSFNSSADEYSWEEEKDLSPHLPNHTAMSDCEFRQSLMQRIREWSALAKSRSPTPECSLSPQLSRSMRRSHSLDRHIGEPALIPEVEMSALEPIELEDCTIKNFECLETKCHYIQDDVESVLSRLHELSQVKDFRAYGEGGLSPHKASSSNQPHPSHRTIRQSGHAPHSSSSSHHHHHHHRHAHRTTWERMPSTAHSDSSRSSRASSVDYSWDLAELGGAKQGEEGEGNDSAAADGLLHRAPVGPGGDGMEFIQEQEDLSSPESGEKRVTSIGEAVGITDYAEKEWKGDTPKAKTIKQGYFSIPELFDCKHMRQVRGDNYCALRSSLFQVLVNGHHVTHRWPGLITIVDRLHELQADSESGFQQWNFAGRLSCDDDKDKFNKITHCVLSLYATIEEMIALPSEEERLTRTLSLLNNSEQFDLQLMEGLKLMMLFRANDLHRDMREGLEVPTFAWLLFARDTSTDVTSFVNNHLNCVGDSAGIDQVEMCLLGDCFGMKLRVARLDHHGQQEFDCTFPDEAPQDWPSICLLAEDDRHYNVPVA